MNDEVNGHPSIQAILKNRVRAVSGWGGYAKTQWPLEKIESRGKRPSYGGIESFIGISTHSGLTGAAAGARRQGCKYRCR